MSASIQDPFLLSSYGLPKHTSSSGNLYATLIEPAPSSEHVVVTSQGDGVHILDASAVHTVVSKTFGPSTLFVCPAVVRSEESTHRVYAAVESASGIPQEEHNRWIWSWSNDLRSGVAGDSIQKILMPSPISRIYAPAELPASLLVVSSDASVHLIGADMQATDPPSSASSSTGETLVKMFLFSRKGVAFTSAITTASEVYLVTVLSKASDLLLRVHGAADHQGCTVLGETRIPTAHSQYLECSMSSTGAFTMLDSLGVWRSWQVTLSGIGLTLSEIASPLRTQGISLARNELSLLGASSSFVLLAGITSSGEKELVVQVWDIRYSVLLAFYSMPLPASLSPIRKAGVWVSLSASTSSHAVLVLSPGVPAKAKAAPSMDTRSSVMMVPLALPASSTIAGALGKAAATANWLKVEPSPVSSSKPKDTDGKEGLINAMRKAMDRGDAEAATNAFSRWMHAHAKTTLDFAFTKQLLNITLQPTKEVATPYSGDVVKHLLEEKAVSSGMVEPSLITALQLRQDWPNIELALRNVVDVPESDVISLLKLAVDASRQSATHEMDVDLTSTVSSPTAIPSLPTILAACTNYTTSPAALRLAFSEKLGEAEDVVAVMGVLDSWMETWHDRPVLLGPSISELRKNEQGIYISTESTTDEGDLPSMDKIVGFLQCLLDASLIALLQHTPAHRMLKRLSNRLVPALEDAAALAQLHAPLAPYARAQTRALRDGASTTKPAPAATQGDWRQRRKAKHEQAALAIGVYQLEELVI